MKLPISIAVKLQLLQQEKSVPATQLKHSIIDKMVIDGIVRKQRTGTNRHLYILRDADELKAYLHNLFGIADLQAYIDGYNSEHLTRNEAIAIASDSKLKPIRSFKGFLVNSFEPISCTLNDATLVIDPTKGTFIFINNFETFLPEEDIVIVGIENPENFNHVSQQQYLFANEKILFISRYPQSQAGDVIKWLLSIPNKYLHFGDFDFEGINIYLREYKKHLGERAMFFVPELIESILSEKGNRQLYDRQLHHQPDPALINEDGIIKLLALLHQYKKSLEQEALIRS